MKRILYACKDSKNGIKGLEYLLSNKEFFLQGCLITGECKKIRELCDDNNITTYDDVNRNNIEEDFRDSELDLLLSFSYPIKIQESIIKKAKYGINFHPAPLPEYKGRGCPCHAIYNGEKQWAGTFHILASKLDCGGIIEKRCFDIDPAIQYGMQLSEITWDLGYEMMIELLDSFVKTGEIRYVEQKEEGKYYSQNDIDIARRIDDNDTADIVEKRSRPFGFLLLKAHILSEMGFTLALLRRICYKR